MKITELENRLRKHSEITKSIIQTPFDLNEMKKMEEYAMNKPKKMSITKRTVGIAAVLALCIITATMTPLADSITGFFKDIVGTGGAITGTQYANATNDIRVNVLEISEENENVTIPLELVFGDPTKAPFPYIQEVAIAEYKILDSENKEILKAKTSAEDGKKGTIGDGKVQINLSVGDKELKSGEEYTIIIEKMYGLSKADAPLHITGLWECKFVK